MGLYGSYFQAMGLIKILANGKIFNQQLSFAWNNLIGACSSKLHHKNACKTSVITWVYVTVLFLIFTPWKVFNKFQTLIK